MLASGGLDSCVLIAELAARRRRVYPVYVRAGLNWEAAELNLLRRFLRALGRKNVASITALSLPVDDVAGDHWSVTGRNVPGYRAAIASNYIAGRNLSLLTKAATFCARERIGEIAMAQLESNPFPDARPEFFRAFENAARLGIGLPLRVTTPFLGMTKAEVIRRARALPLELTMSCAKPRGTIHCGACTKCAERVRAFGEAGVHDPTRYSRPPRG